MLKRYLWFIPAVLPIGFISSAKAFCPICTAAVVGGLGLSRWLKIDDTISGLWIGGLTVAISGWTINWCNRKKINFWGRDFFIALAYYALVLLPLYFYEILGHPENTLWGVDKLLLGVFVGSIFFYAAYLQYENYKKKHGKALFPFQKIATPIGTLLVLSLIFYFLTR